MKNRIGIALLLVFNLLTGQNETKLQEYLPPSPTAQELMKYGEYPVGMYTGVANISIPLYAVQSKSLNLPIAISYHGAGIQVDQTASWVGLGWSLSYGGTISKIPRGMPDDASGGFLNSNVEELSNLTFNHDYFEDAVSGDVDTESDIYHYSVAGHSGKFFFDRSKNIRLIDHAPVDISYNSGKFTIISSDGVIFEFNEPETTETVSWNAGDPIGATKSYVSTWHLTKVIAANRADEINLTYEVENGVYSYQYHYSESTGSKVNLSDCPPSVDTNVHDFGSLSSQSRSISYPKRIKEISFKNGKVSFIRNSDRQDRVNDRLEKLIVYDISKSTEIKVKEIEFVHEYFVSNLVVNYPKTNSAITDNERKRLKLTKLIENDIFSNKVKEYAFEYDTTYQLPPIETNGKDLWGYYNGKNSNSTLIPKQDFQYLGNDVGDADRDPNEAYMKTGILTKIVFPTKGYTKFEYEAHSYNTTENQIVTNTKSVFAVGSTTAMGSGVPFVDRDTIVANYSGFATLSIEGSDMNDAQLTSYPTIRLKKLNSVGYLIEHSIDPTTYSYPMNPSEVTKSFSPVWFDKGETYIIEATANGPSSSTEFGGTSFMMASLDYKEESGVPVQVSKMAGGLRIKSIKSYDSNDTFSMGKSYNYFDPFLLTPETFLKEQYLDTDVQTWNSCTPNENANQTCLAGGTTRRFYYGGTVQSLTLNGGSSVVYGKVEESQIDSNLNTLGKSLHEFDVQTDDILPVITSYSGGVMLLKKDWLGGQLRRKRIYNTNAASEDDFIAMDSLSYETHNYSEAYKMYKIVHSKRISGSCQVINQNTDINNRFTIIEYPIIQGLKRLKNQKNVLVTGNSKEIEASTTMYYDNDTHLQATRKELQNSNGEQLLTKTIYPDDVTLVGGMVDGSTLKGGSFSAPELYALNRMKKDSLHQVGIPIQVETYKKDGATETLLSVQRSSFVDNGSDFIALDAVKMAKGTDNVDARIIYKSYYSDGNPKELQRTNGPVIVYIWGYNGQYPVAKIENCSFSQVEALSSFGPGFSLGDSGLTQSQEIQLRNSLTGAFVTTYSYKPLVGVTSITDPKGQTTTYQYDSFNRLEKVIDHNGKVLSENQYNYKSQ